MCPPVRGLTTLSKLAGSYVQEYSKHIDCKIHFLPSVAVSVLSPKNSTTETMKRLPILGQFLGRLCWNPYVTADGECTFLKNLFGETKYLPSIETYELINPGAISGVFLSAATSRRLLLRCLWGLFSEHPGNAVERKANQWIRVWTGLSLYLLIENFG